MFADVNNTWTEEKTKLKVETLKAIIIVKCNVTFSCVDFYHFIKTKPELLNKIAKTAKYISGKGFDEQNNNNSEFENEYYEDGF